MESSEIRKGQSWGVLGAEWNGATHARGNSPNKLGASKQPTSSPSSANSTANGPATPGYPSSS